MIIVLLNLIIIQPGQASKYKVCTIDYDCGAAGYWTCQNVTDHFDTVCVHKNVFPMHLNEFVGCFLITVTEIIANAGGTAGGGIIIPLIMIFYGFETS